MSATTESDLKLCENKFELVNLSNEENFVIDSLPYADNRYEHSFYIHSAFLDCLIGKGGSRIKKLSKETKTLIRLHNPSSIALIIGEKQDVIIARKCIDQIILESVEEVRKTKKTHSLVVPANLSNIQENFMKFKKNILKNGETYAPGLKEGMFTGVGRLHVTLASMIIIENEERQKALEAFDYCNRNIVSPIMEQNGPLTLQFKGVKSKNTNLNKVKILYTEVFLENGYFQGIVDRINDYILQQGLGRLKKSGKKAWLTLINVRHIRPRTERFVRDVIDATNIINDYKDYDFGKINFTNIHFVEKGTRDRSGFYKIITTIELTN